MTVTPRRRKAPRVYLVVGGIALAGLGCSGGPTSSEEVREDPVVEVFVTLPPLADVVERVGGERVRVEVLVESGRDPHTFEPTPRQMAGLAKAALLCTAGAPFEEQLALKAEGMGHELVVIDTSSGIPRDDAEEHAADNHDHHGHAHHDHGHHGDGMDPHVWLAPAALKVMARNACGALASVDPANRSEYEANLAGFLAETEATDERIKKMLAPYDGSVFYVFHPAFGHFAEAYGLRQKAVERGGKEPSAKELQALIEEARADRARVVFVQPQHGTGSAETIAKAIGADLVTLDPLARDVLANLETIAVRIEQAVKP